MVGSGQCYSSVYNRQVCDSRCDKFHSREGSDNTEREDVTRKTAVRSESVEIPSDEFLLWEKGRAEERRKMAGVWGLTGIMEAVT